MFLSKDQIALSVGRLARVHPFFGTAFLALKDANLPIGYTSFVVFTQAADRILQEHYKVANYKGFYSPFLTSNKAKRWLAPRYSSTSLQRITTDTFRDALIHPKGSSEWGWQQDYVDKLSGHLDNGKIPAFDLAVWLFRATEWSEHVSPETIRDKVFIQYGISGDETERLFDTQIHDIAQGWLQGFPISDIELFDIIGTPPDVQPTEDAALRYLKLKEVGPADVLLYEPEERLNIITGDNSLGKTFLLECIWWALTGSWLDYPAEPRNSANKNEPEITFQVAAQHGRSIELSSKYNWDKQQWKKIGRRDAVPGLVIYARSDSSFAVWDPVRLQLNDQEERKDDNAGIFINRRQIWDGIAVEATAGRRQWVCNGLLRDWATWQAGGRYEQHYQALTACLDSLSPSDIQPLQPGNMRRLSFDSRDIPTLRLPYDDVPILYASAGVQRIVALAYMMVWAWYEHLTLSSLVRRPPQQRIVMMIDEVEAHLHPKWQRAIVSALMEAVTKLSDKISPQLHLATHSPLVLASAEPVFDEDSDGLYHLEASSGTVTLENIPFVKRGRADLWLMSPVFGLQQPRSLPAEKAISDAKSLQLSQQASELEVREVDDRLIQNLAPDDDFWPRWNYFAEQHGARK